MGIFVKGDKFVLNCNKKFIGVFNTFNEAKRIDIFVKELLKNISYNDLHEAKVEAVFNVYHTELGKRNVYELMNKKLNNIK